MEAVRANATRPAFKGGNAAARFDGGDKGSGHLSQQFVAGEALALMLAEEPGEIVWRRQPRDAAVQKNAVDELVLEDHVIVE